MTQYEMTEALSEKCQVSLADARSALETGDWNMLTATHLLEQESFRRMQAVSEAAAAGEAMAVQLAPQADASREAAAEETSAAEAIHEVAAEAAEGAQSAKPKKHDVGKGIRVLGSHLRRLVACGNRNRLVVRRGGATVLELPVTALVVLMLCAFWVCVPLLVVGLFAGCRYSFSGKELDRENLNRALDKVADAAGSLKKSVTQA